MMACMDSDERNHLEFRLSILEVVEHAFARRNEVFEIVASSEDTDEAQDRIHALLGVREPHISQAVLDMQMSTWTRARRKKVSAEAEEIRRRLNE